MSENPPNDSDDLPEDLDIALAERTTIPDNARRRISAIIYGVTGAALVVLWAFRGEGVLVNRGVLLVGLVLCALSAYHALAGWKTKIDELDALAVAGAHLGVPAGHASAQMSWRGIASRPTWRVLVFSAEDKPKQRGLVLVDGVDGRVVEHYLEANPEDWTDPARRNAS